MICRDLTGTAPFTKNDHAHRHTTDNNNTVFSILLPLRSTPSEERQSGVIYKHKVLNTLLLTYTISGCVCTVVLSVTQRNYLLANRSPASAGHIYNTHACVLWIISSSSPNLKTRYHSNKLVIKLVCVLDGIFHLPAFLNSSLLISRMHERVPYSDLDRDDR